MYPVENPACRQAGGLFSYILYVFAAGWRPAELNPSPCSID